MRLFALAALLALFGTAHAQPMQEVVTTDNIDIRAEQARTFSLDSPVSRLSLSREGVAEVMPETDRTFTVKGIAPGEVMMTAYGSDGRVLHRANIRVGQSAGLVRIYGVGDEKGKTAKDFIGYYCSGTGCGRADPDKFPVPYSTTITETQDKGNGRTTSTSREYR